LEEMGIDLFDLLPHVVGLLPAYPEKPLPPLEEMLAGDPAKYFPEVTLGVGGAACVDTARRRGEGPASPLPGHRGPRDGLRR
jgi:hypothetical protein